jgi:hypothetical protein
MTCSHDYTSPDSQLVAWVYDDVTDELKAEEQTPQQEDGTSTKPAGPCCGQRQGKESRTA